MPELHYKTGERVEFGDRVKRGRTIGTVQAIQATSTPHLFIVWQIQPDIEYSALEPLENLNFDSRYEDTGIGWM